MKQRLINQNNSRVSILERVGVNNLLKKLNLTQLQFLKKSVDERIEKLQEKESKYDIKG